MTEDDDARVRLAKMVGRLAYRLEDLMCYPVSEYWQVMDLVPGSMRDRICELLEEAKNARPDA